jgi:predicted O-methyltransferase YrrM
MLRFDIINYLISVNGYKSFLEIGTQAKINFTSINVDRKVCVDPDPNAEADYQITSDDYFDNNFEKFDIVFVDGLHHADVAYRDIVNSLRRLNPGGCIVVHDVIPY